MVVDEKEGALQTKMTKGRRGGTEAVGVVFPNLRNKNTRHPVKLELFLIAYAYVL